jgi:hypothetical protein
MGLKIACVCEAEHTQGLTVEQYVLTSNASLVQQQILFVTDVEYPGLQVAHVADDIVDVF